MIPVMWNSTTGRIDLSRQKEDQPFPGAGSGGTEHRGTGTCSGVIGISIISIVVVVTQVYAFVEPKLYQ